VGACGDSQAVIVCFIEAPSVDCRHILKECTTLFVNKQRYFFVDVKRSGWFCHFIEYTYCLVFRIVVFYAVHTQMH